MVVFYFRLIVLFAFLLSVASLGTHITFPDFLTEDNFMALGDAVHNPFNRSYVLNAKGPCGELLNKKKVRIQDVATGRAASFSTSFSFTFTTHGSPWNDSSDLGSGIVFKFVRSVYFDTMKEFVSGWGWSSGCKGYRTDPNLIYNRPGFGVIIATDYNANLKAPSNNYIRIGNNADQEYDISAYTHNLCGNDTHCSYFSNGRIFTAWIDFNSSAQSLEVRLANGSTSSVTKPLQALLLIPHYEMAKALGDDVYLAFWGTSVANHLEKVELLSWSFFSSEIPDLNTPYYQSLLFYLKARTWTGIAIGVLGTVTAWAIIRSISRLTTKSRYHCRYTARDYTTGPHKFSYAELCKATENFDDRNLLGTGASGSVYRGSLEGPVARGGKLVAVKQIRVSETKQAESLFHAELASLGQIRHRNVLQLQGWCQEKGRLLLVFDYMPNGGLNEWLHKSQGSVHREALSLQIRLSILEGVGAALEYLHEDCPSVVLHRDIKFSNVLLDANFKAHLGDFGLARLMDHHMLDKTTLPAGTLGYMAPEMPYTGKATKESDVYSFEIMLLEIMCGRRPFDVLTREPEDLLLLHCVWRAREAGSLLTVVDPRLLQTLQPSKANPLQDEDCAYTIKNPLPLILKSHNLTNTVTSTISTVVDVDTEVHKLMVVQLLHLGLLCCLPNPKAQPTVGQVNGILQQIRETKCGSPFSSIVMPFLPHTKPLEIHKKLGLLQTTLNPPSCSTPSIISVHAKFSMDSDALQQAFGSLVYKED